MSGTHVGRMLRATAAAVVFIMAAGAQATVRGTAGPYQLEMATDPSPVPVGGATIVVRVADAHGAPVSGASVSVLAQMPAMPMGEKAEPATPDSGSSGIYRAPARFAMDGAYNVSVRITGSAGAGAGTLSLRTGQDTGSLTGASAPSGAAAPPASGGSWWPWLAGIAVLLLGGYTVYRMRRTGQRFNAASALQPRILGGVAVLAGVLALSVWAVRRFTQPGHMTVLEAQSMDMTAMQAPAGAMPVTLARAVREPLRATVQYEGSAVAFDDVTVTPRVTGVITAMAVYPGDHVRAGQVVARLDTSELASRVAEQATNTDMAEHQSAVAVIQARAARSGATRAVASIAAAQSALDAARSDLAGARSEASAASSDRDGARAALAAAHSGVLDAQGAASAAQADNTYWQAQVKRSAALLREGAISQQEYQQDRDRADSARAAWRQALARSAGAASGVTAAEARMRASDAMVGAAAAKAAGLEAKVRGAQSGVEQARADAAAADAGAAAAEHEILHSQAGVDQARAQLNTARVVEGYTELRATVDGVVTDRAVSPGTLVQPGQAILRISREHPIRLQANVPASALASIRPGAAVRAWSSRDAAHPALCTVTAIFPAADPVARTAVVEARYANADGRFIPGEAVTLEIATGSASRALSVPSAALTWPVAAPGATPQAYVWVAVTGPAGRRAHRVAVTAGISDGDRAEILTGLHDGDQVIVAGADGLQEGDAVTAAGGGR